MLSGHIIQFFNLKKTKMKKLIFTTLMIIGMANCALAFTCVTDKYGTTICW